MAFRNRPRRRPRPRQSGCSARRVAPLECLWSRISRMVPKRAKVEDEDDDENDYDTLSRGSVRRSFLLPQRINEKRYPDHIHKKRQKLPSAEWTR
jgi:hypothetical protein